MATEQIKTQAKEILERSITRRLIPDDYSQWIQVAFSAWGMPKINQQWDFTALTKDSRTSIGLFDGSTMLGGSLNIAKIGDGGNPYLLVHMLGVNQNYQGIGVGKRLMDANYSLIQNGQLGPIDTVKLTSDPFDTRNARLYLHHSRMHANTYIPDAYKGLSDDGGDRHKDLPSDRLYYEAKPNSPWVKQGVLPSPEQITELIQQTPQILDSASSSPVILVETPKDFIALKEHKEEAAGWQSNQAETFTTLFAKGYTAVDHVVVDLFGKKRHFITCINNFDENNPHCLMQAISNLR